MVRISRLIVSNTSLRAAPRAHLQLLGPVVLIDGRLRLAYVPQAVEPEFVRFVHEMATSGRILAISGPDPCLFRGDEAIRGSRNKMPGVVMAVSGLCLIRTERNPIDALICLKLHDARLNRATENLEAVQCALVCLARRLVRDILYNDKPVRPSRGIRERPKVLWQSARLQARERRSGEPIPLRRKSTERETSDPLHRTGPVARSRRRRCVPV